MKCDQKIPCKTCQKRGHPEICVYNVEYRRHEQGRKERRIENNLQNAAASSSSEVSPAAAEPGRHQLQGRRPDSTPRGVLGDKASPGPENLYSGEDSIPSIIRRQHSEAEGSQRLSSVLGLQNTFNNYPFMDPQTPESHWKRILTIVPEPQHVFT